MLLFAPGCRPNAADVGAALLAERFGQVSLDPAAGETEGEGAVTRWVELFANGLTYDLLGLNPGSSLTLEAGLRTLGDRGRDRAGHEAIGIAPGPHLAGAVRAVPVVMTMLKLGAALLRHCEGSAAACWRPSGLIVGKPLMIGLIDHWSQGGPFPAPALSDLVAGADGSIASAGLDFFLGREIRLASGIAGDRAEAARLIARLADRFIGLGEPVAGERIALGDGRILRVAIRPDSIFVEPG